jgi:hypothetical protein
MKLEIFLEAFILALIIFLAFLLFITVTLSFLSELTGNTHVEVSQTNCFDKYGNKIEGLKCEEKTSCSDFRWTLGPRCKNTN